MITFAALVRDEDQELQFEEWRPVVGWPEYEVSDHGRLRRVAPAPGATPGKILKAYIGTSGRVVFSLSRSSRVRKRFIHHLVLDAFVGARPHGMECAHGDGNPLNNRLENLRWDTPRGNAADKLKHGTSSVPGYSHKGEQHPMVKLTNAQVYEIRARLNHGERATLIARDCGVSQYAVGDIKRGRSWRHL